MVNGLQVRFRVFPATHLVLYKKACASCIVHDAIHVNARAETRQCLHSPSFHVQFYGVAWSDIVTDTEAVVAQCFGEVPHGTKYVVGISFVGPSGLALVKQDFMHSITFHDAGHMKDAGHVPYGGVFM